MNFQYNKWAESLIAEEKLYPSARLLGATLNCYVKSQTHWKNKIDTPNKTHAQWSETCMQNEWRKATVLLSWAKECRQSNDLVQTQYCILCEGEGQLSCPVCKGTGNCDDCQGKVGDSIPCLLSPMACEETGKCPYCGGTGSDSVRCSVCKETGKCPPCLAKGAEKCPVCNGTGSFPP